MARLELCIQGVEPALSVRQFTIREAASEPFSISIVARSPRGDLALEEIVLRAGTLSIAKVTCARNSSMRSLLPSRQIHDLVSQQHVCQDPPRKAGFDSGDLTSHLI